VNGTTSLASATFTITPAAASALAFAVEPSDAAAGAALAPMVQVRVSDAFGNVVPGAPVALSVTGGGTLTGGEARESDAQGLASFPSVALSQAGPHTLIAVSGVLSVTSRTFAITAAGVTAFEWVVQPSAVTVAAAITPAVQVRALDTFGNRVAGAPVSLTLSGTGTLTGVGAVVTDAQGLASFATLRVDRAGVARLVAGSGAATSTSASFTVSCPIWRSRRSVRTR
jgi:hypothetical protein